MPTAHQILAVWEKAHTQTQIQRALTLLAFAVPTRSADELARYSVGQRDRELLALRERLFGSRLTAAAQCPICREQIEVDFTVGDITAEAATEAGSFHDIETDSYGLRFRLPECGDLANLEASAPSSNPSIRLLERCVTVARIHGNDVSVQELPDEVVTALSRRMSELDPQGDVQLVLNCPSCQHQWSAPFDVASYLWIELQSCANRLLREVNVLASAYGWPETDILALSETRRRAYLEILQS